MTPLRSLTKNLGRRRSNELSPTAERVVSANLTYLNQPKIALLESCLREVQRNRVSGDFLEMGVALGGSGIIIASQMKRGRRFHGYDVFAMIPPPSKSDPPTVHERYRTIAEGRSEGIGGDVYYGYVDNLYDKVLGNFARFGQPVDGDRVQLHQGLFEDTLHPSGPVALAHIDCDWYEPVKLCIERIWPSLSRGGMMIFDDYADYGGCTRAVDKFAGAQPDAKLQTQDPSAVLLKE